jgi:hypothetical protein
LGNRVSSHTKFFIALLKKHSDYGRPIRKEVSFTRREIGRLIGRTRPRQRATFARAEAEARIDDPNWGVPYFSAKNLRELELYYETQPTIVDSNWIMFAPLGCNGRINTDDLSWIMRYWAGEPFNDCPVWELLANGVALILDTRICEAGISRLTYSNLDGAPRIRNGNTWRPHHPLFAA